LAAIKASGNNDIKRRQLLKDSFTTQYDSTISFRKSIDKKKLSVEYNRVRVESLQAHIKEFTKYEYIFFWAGITFAIAGIWGWFGLMRKAPKP
jgi:hypothetical protein